MSSKRRPIAYTPQHSAEIFRPKGVVEEERAAIAERRDEEPSLPDAQPDAPVAAEAPRIASEQISDFASALASYHGEIVPTIRKVVKEPGREVSFVRLSPEEKGELADLVHHFKRRGQKTTENEINRIAINYLLEDYRRHEEGSVLARTLAALRA